MSTLLGFWGWNNYERMGLGVNGVKVPTHVVGSIINTKSGKAIDGVVSNTN